MLKATPEAGESIPQNNQMCATARSKLCFRAPENSGCRTRITRAAAPAASAPEWPPPAVDRAETFEDSREHSSGNGPILASPGHALVSEDVDL